MFFRIFTRGGIPAYYAEPVTTSRRRYIFFGIGYVVIVLGVPRLAWFGWTYRQLRRWVGRLIA